MDKIKEFRIWLDNNTEYTTATKSNIISRLKRVDKILPLQSEPVYIFNLSRLNEFQVLSTSVKSQIRRAISLYLSFNEDKGCN